MIYTFKNVLYKIQNTDNIKNYKKKRFLKRIKTRIKF